MAFIQQLRHETYVSKEGKVVDKIKDFPRMKPEETKEIFQWLKDQMIEMAKRGKDSYEIEIFNSTTYQNSTKKFSFLGRTGTEFFGQCFSSHHDGLLSEDLRVWYWKVMRDSRDMNDEAREMACKRFNGFAVQFLHYLSEEWRKVEKDVIVSVYDTTTHHGNSYTAIYYTRHCGLRFVWNYPDTGDMYFSAEKVRKYETKFKRALFEYDESVQAASKREGPPSAKKIKI